MLPGSIGRDVFSSFSWRWLNVLWMRLLPLLSLLLMPGKNSKLLILLWEILFRTMDHLLRVFLLVLKLFWVIPIWWMLTVLIMPCVFVNGFSSLMLLRTLYSWSPQWNFAWHLLSGAIAHYPLGFQGRDGPISHFFVLVILCRSR